MPEGVGALSSLPGMLPHSCYAAFAVNLVCFTPLPPSPTGVADYRDALLAQCFRTIFNQVSTRDETIVDTVIVHNRPRMVAFHLIVRAAAGR